MYTNINMNVNFVLKMNLRIPCDILQLLTSFIIFLKTVEKGKLAVRRGRKALGPAWCGTAGLPTTWGITMESPVR